MTIHVAIPIQDELDNIPSLLHFLRRQTFPEFKVWICVNQPESWWNNPTKKAIAERNVETLAILRKETQLNLVVIDKASPSSGWIGKKTGVGWARKLCMDAISQMADPEDIILSLDADTSFSENYFAAIAEAFAARSSLSAISVPYFHPLGSDPQINRSMLIYEIYMRHYFLNLKRISSPYAFTALGSAIAVRVSAYVHIGGISPKQAGEDFYLLQKIVKSGILQTSLSETVYPQARLSARVPFGTGKAIEQQLANGNTPLFRFFEACYFDHIAKTYQTFPDLFSHDIETPLSPFLREQFRTNDLWGPLRKNYKQKHLFVRACTEKVDGLRILQYLKGCPPIMSAEESLAETCSFFDTSILNNNEKTLSFASATIQELDQIRKQLFELCR